MAKQEARFGKHVERQDGKDFPFYNDKPSEIKSWQWLVIVASVVASFGILSFSGVSTNLQGLLPRTLFTVVPLGVFAYFAKNNWKALFAKPKRADYKAIISYMVLNLAVSIIFAMIVKHFFGTNANPATDGLRGATVLEIASFYIGTFIQIIGEELLTILPFLAIMYFLFIKTKLSRKKSVIAAWIITSVWFGTLHLPTYGWDVPQALIVIGGARVVLTFAYVKTKNLWVSFGAHVAGDWLIFTTTIV